ncbi:Vam6/Vps39-like protein-like [Homarus americanus]|uniref:Vam6/Vps39-like protein-like n=1 Tax=Homarus americanus TaxID=6706 RepID=A0A8J5MTW5_HOMAM|nr:Vam6/Vps39-like protein-like [Homarus americanus]
MHDAYEAIPILEKLPLQIEAVTAYDGNLVVGTRQGHLLMYTVTPGTTRRWDVALLCSNKNFSRKPIVQVAVIPEHQIIVVHDLTAFNLPLLCTLSQTKGATAFDLDIKHHVSLTGDGVVTVRLVVAVRRKLQLFYWKARKFHQLREDLALPDVPRALTWCMEAIAVAFKHEYWLVKLTGEQKELFATGRSQEPLITRMVDGEQLALAHDKESIFVDADGNATCSYTLKWVEQPLSLGKSQVYIASSSHVWCLHSIPINQQIPQLLGEKQFGLALKLVDVWDEDEDAKTQMQKHIQHLQAIHLFCSKSYPDAMKLFFTLNTDLPFVIGMYPDMVPEEYRSRLRYPYPIPALSGADLEQALQALIHFLLEMRHQLCSSDSEARTEDTNDSLVQPLLRMRDSRVSVVEGERVLRHSHKYPELVLLLQTRGLHQRALQLLIRHAKRPDSPLCGHQHTVNYLQHLGPQHIDLIFEYGGWVLKSHPEDGLKIFIGDKSTSGEVDQLPRPKWGDTTPLLHNELIHQYRDIVVAPFTSSDPANVEEEKGRRKIVCEKLLKFLNESKYYTAATLLIHFPYDGLHEERAVLLGRLGQHHQALSIYTNTLRDTQAALRYCQKHYTPSGPGSELLVSPIDIRSTSGSPVMQQQQQAGKPDVETVLELLQNHLHCIDLGQALKVLPDEVTLNLLKPFIHASFNLASSTSEELVARQKLKIMLSEYTYCAVCSKRFTKHSAFAWYPNGDIVHFSCQNQR